MRMEDPVCLNQDLAQPNEQVKSYILGGEDPQTEVLEQVCEAVGSGPRILV